MQIPLEKLARQLTVPEKRVLLELTDGEWVYPARQIAADAGIPIDITRKILRYFRRIGIAEHGFLMSEDYRIAGSGTHLNRYGLDLQQMVRNQGKS
jgi:hypothetical protein